MQSNPLALEAPPRFDPVFLTEGDLEDLATFIGTDRQACLERLRSYSSTELTAAWRQTNPKTPEEILDFYGSTDLYVWELMQWHASAARRPYWEALDLFARRYPQSGWPRVYDFGCGVGTDGLFLAARGYEVALVDVEGPAFRLARHRFARRNLRAQFIESKSILPTPLGIYDAIVCFDVFEHLPDPVTAARRLVHALRPGGVLIQRANFGDEGGHPCHLHEGVRRFGGLRWHVQLAGLGLRSVGSFLYEKADGITALLQRLRFMLWRSTGFWLVYTGMERHASDSGTDVAKMESCTALSPETIQPVGLAGDRV